MWEILTRRIPHDDREFVNETILQRVRLETPENTPADYAALMEV